jgi:hypothetical protein
LFAHGDGCDAKTRGNGKGLPLEEKKSCVLMLLSIPSMFSKGKRYTITKILLIVQTGVEIKWHWTRFTRSRGSKTAVFPSVTNSQRSYRSATLGTTYSANSWEQLLVYGIAAAVVVAAVGPAAIAAAAAAVVGPILAPDAAAAAAVPATASANNLASKDAIEDDATLAAVVDHEEDLRAATRSCRCFLRVATAAIAAEVIAWGS